MVECGVLLALGLSGVLEQPLGVDAVALRIGRLAAGPVVRGRRRRAPAAGRCAVVEVGRFGEPGPKRGEPVGAAAAECAVVVDEASGLLVGAGPVEAAGGGRGVVLVREQKVFGEKGATVCVRAHTRAGGDRHRLSLPLGRSVGTFRWDVNSYNPQRLWGPQPLGVVGATTSRGCGGHNLWLYGPYNLWLYGAAVVGRHDDLEAD